MLAIESRVSSFMAKKSTIPPPVAESTEPPSETVRLAGDLIEMLRDICYNSRDSRGKRLKISQFMDEHTRSWLVGYYADFKKKRGDAKPGA